MTVVFVKNREVNASTKVMLLIELFCWANDDRSHMVGEITVFDVLSNILREKRLGSGFELSVFVQLMKQAASFFQYVGLLMLREMKNDN